MANLKNYPLIVMSKKNIINKTNGFTLVEILISSTLLIIIFSVVISFMGTFKQNNTLSSRIDANEQGRMFLYKLQNRLISAKKILQPSSWWDGSYPCNFISFYDRNFVITNYGISNGKVYSWIGIENMSSAISQGHAKIEISDVNSDISKSYFHYSGRQKMKVVITLRRKDYNSGKVVEYVRLSDVYFLRGIMAYQ